MDEDSELKYVRRLILHRLTPLDINVDITLRGNGTVSLSASKILHSGNIRHVCVDSTGLIEAIWKLIKYVEHEIELWIDKDLYC